MSDLRFKVGWQVDNVNRIEGTLLGTDAAADAEAFGDEGDLALRRDFDAEFACADNRAGLLAFLPAFLGLALVRVDDSNTGRWC